MAEVPGADTQADACDTKTAHIDQRCVITRVFTRSQLCGSRARICGRGIGGERQFVAVPRLGKGPRAGQQTLSQNLDRKGADTLALLGFAGRFPQYLGAIKSEIRGMCSALANGTSW